MQQRGLGGHCELRTVNVAALSTGAIDALLTAGSIRTSPLRAVSLHQFHGASTRCPVATPASSGRANGPKPTPLTGQTRSGYSPARACGTAPMCSRQRHFPHHFPPACDLGVRPLPPIMAGRRWPRTHTVLTEIYRAAQESYTHTGCRAVGFTTRLLQEWLWFASAMAVRAAVRAARTSVGT